MKFVSIALAPFRAVRGNTRPGWIGVDIGSVAVKIAQVQRRGKKWEVLHARMFANAPDSDPLATAELGLRTVLGDRRKWLLHPTACGTSMRTELRCVDLPARQGIDVSTEAAKQADIRPDETSLVAWPSTWAGRNTKTLPYHAIAMQQEAAVGVAQRLMSCRAACQTLEGLPFSLARLARLVDDPELQVTAIVDWAASDPLFVLVRGGRPYFTRKLRNCSYRGLVNGIAEHLELDAADISSLLQEIGSKVQRKHAITELMNTVNELSRETRRRFVDEIARTIAFLRTEGDDQVPKLLRIVGGGSCLPNITSEVAEASGIETEVWKLPVAADQSFGQEAPGVSPIFATAISLSAIPLL